MVRNNYFKVKGSVGASHARLEEIQKDTNNHEALMAIEYEESELISIYKRVYRRLSSECQKAFDTYCNEGLKWKEIAKLWGKSDSRMSQVKMECINKAKEIARSIMQNKNILP